MRVESKIRWDIFICNQGLEVSKVFNLKRDTMHAFPIICLRVYLDLLLEQRPI